MDHRLDQLKDYNNDPLGWWVCLNLDCIHHILHLGPTTKAKINRTGCPAMLRDPLGRVYSDQRAAMKNIYNPASRIPSIWSRWSTKP